MIPWKYWWCKLKDINSLFQLLIVCWLTPWENILSIGGRIAADSAQTRESLFSVEPVGWSPREMILWLVVISGEGPIIVLLKKGVGVGVWPCSTSYRLLLRACWWLTTSQVPTDIFTLKATLTTKKNSVNCQLLWLLEGNFQGYWRTELENL
jgi:hypothetical protein